MPIHTANSGPTHGDRTATTLDVVIPFYNEEEVLPLLFDRLEEVFSKENRERHAISAVRYLLIDDGSTDGSAELICERIRGGAPAHLLRLARNFGHQAAVSAGLDTTDAEATAVIDADLQDPPGLILKMLERWREGYDVVYGQRRKRKEAVLRRLGYWSFYRIVAFLADSPVPLDSGDFCLMGRNVVDAIRQLPEKLRFPRILRAWVGYRQTALPYERPARQAGRRRYNFRGLYQLATDGITASSIRPLRLAQLFSFCFALLTVVILAVLFVELVKGSSSGSDLQFLLVYALLSAGIFVQTICLYVIGAYVGRTYLEAKGRPPYLVMETITGSTLKEPDGG